MYFAAILCGCASSSNQANPNSKIELFPHISTKTDVINQLRCESLECENNHDTERCRCISSSHSGNKNDCFKIGSISNKGGNSIDDAIFYSLLALASSIMTRDQCSHHKVNYVSYEVYFDSDGKLIGYKEAER